MRALTVGCLIAILAGCAWTKQPFETGRILTTEQAEYAVLFTLSVRDPVEGAQLPGVFAPAVAPLEWINLGLSLQVTHPLDPHRDAQWGIEIDQVPVFFFIGQVVPTFWVGARQAVSTHASAPSLVGARVLVRPALFCWSCDKGRVEIVSGAELRYVQSVGAAATQGVASVYVRGEIFAYSGWGGRAGKPPPTNTFDRRGSTRAWTIGGYVGGLVEGDDRRILIRAHAAYMQSLKIGRFEPGWVRTIEMAYMNIWEDEPEAERD